MFPTLVALALSACKPAATTLAQPTRALEQQHTEPPSVEPTRVESGSFDATASEAMLDPWFGVDPTGQTITFWHLYTQDQKQALLKIVEAFNKTNEWGIAVQAEYQGSYNDIFDRMLGVLNTIYAPDLVVAHQDQAATYQLADALVDMNSLVNSIQWGFTTADKNDFFPGPFAQDVFPNFGNARLGFPFNRSMEVMYYNKDRLMELGYDAPPTTPDQFKEMACKAALQQSRRGQPRI